MAHIFMVCKNGAGFLRILGRARDWLCQAWGQGEHACNIEKSSNTLLEPFWMQTQTNQMCSNPNATLNHHMKCQTLASCQVIKSSDKVQYHVDFLLLQMGCYILPSYAPGSLTCRSRG